MDRSRQLLANLLLLAAFAALGCGGDDDDDNGGDPGASPDASSPDASSPDASSPDASSGACSVTPGMWSAPNFTTNAAGALRVRGQLDMLVGAALMRGAEQDPTLVVVDDVADLTVAYEAGDPSLADIVTPGYAPIIGDAFSDFVAVIAARSQDLIDDDNNWTPRETGGPAAGGIFGTSERGINAGGLEVRQLVDKGLFGGGAFYHYAFRLTQGPIDEATIDAIAAAWGSNETLATEMVTDSANYTFAMGFHAAAAASLAAAKAYAADDNCVAQRDAAVVAFFRTWEKSLVARTVFYANAAATGLAQAASGPAGDDAKTDALHVLGEGLGLTLGFHGLPNPSSGPLAVGARLLTDANIQAMATAVGVDIADLSASATGEFVEDPAGFAKGVQALEAIVMEVFDVTAEEIASYRAPTPG